MMNKMKMVGWQFSWDDGHDHDDDDDDDEDEEEDDEDDEYSRGCWT